MDPGEQKNALINEVNQARAAVLAAVDKLSSSQVDQVFLGVWNVKDLLAHLIGWDETNRQAIAELCQSRLPEFYNHIDPDWRSYNALLVARHRCDDLRLLLEDLAQSHARLMDAVAALEPQDMSRDWGVRYRGYRVTIARLLQAEARDELVHARQIMDAFGVPTGEA